jgi:hypothetical protein
MINTIDSASVKNIAGMAAEFTPEPPLVPAILSHQSAPIAKGEMRLEGERLTFYPADLKIMGTSLDGSVELRIVGSEKVLIVEKFRWHEGCNHGNGFICMQDK